MKRRRRLYVINQVKQTRSNDLTPNLYITYNRQIVTRAIVHHNIYAGCRIQLVKPRGSHLGPCVMRQMSFHKSTNPTGVWDVRERCGAVE